MGCQCDTKGRGGINAVVGAVRHKTGWCDESLLEICAAINHKSSISSEAYAAPECTACNSTHFNPTPWNERRRTQRSNQFHYNWPKMSFLAANISHRRANLYLYWQHVGLFIKKEKKKFYYNWFSVLRAVQFLYNFTVWIYWILIQHKHKTKSYYAVTIAPVRENRFGLDVSPSAKDGDPKSLRLAKKMRYWGCPWIQI